LEPACGDGNFLAEILHRKLLKVKNQYGNNHHDYEKYAVLAVTSIYGVDILPDNVALCISRLFDIFNKEYLSICKEDATDDCRQAVLHILRRNILCGDALTMKTSDGNPIIFSEWSFLTGDLVKRRDFRFDELLRGHQIQRDLFTQNWEYDSESKAYIPIPIQQFSPITYTKIHKNV
ncbi:MAG: SAM-dependent DNA methyltransferase, partial [Bacteroidales bacterium]|nr:SAM-dependent DNA methyltransferase [Bacteroidales bacterium]